MFLLLFKGCYVSSSLQFLSSSFPPFESSLLKVDLVAVVNFLSMMSAGSMASSVASLVSSLVSAGSMASLVSADLVASFVFRILDEKTVYYSPETPFLI